MGDNFCAQGKGSLRLVNIDKQAMPNAPELRACSSESRCDRWFAYCLITQANRAYRSFVHRVMHRQVCSILRSPLTMVCGRRPQ